MALNLISLTHLGNSWNCSNTPALLERRNPTPFEWDFFLQSHFFLFLKSLYLFVIQIDMAFKLFAILQKYDFSSKSQRLNGLPFGASSCLRYCRSAIFQANHKWLSLPPCGERWCPWPSPPAVGRGLCVGYLFGTHYLFLLKCLVSWFYFVSSH